MDQYTKPDSIQAFDQLAEKYQERFMDLEIYNETYDFFLRALPDDCAVLEIGCGPGNIAKYLLTKKPGLSITGIDLAPNMISLARKNIPSGKFLVMDCRNIKSLSKQFEGVAAGFCIPYLDVQESIQLIRDAARLLTTGGALYFSVIEGDYSKSALETSSDGKYKTFVHYYLEEDLKEVLEENFSSYHCMRVPFKKNDHENSIHLIIIAKKR